MFYEEKQIDDVIFFRTSPHGDWKPKKINYTKKMKEANIPPHIGMNFICNDCTDHSRIKDFKGKEVEVIGVCESGERVVITFKHESLGIGCGCFDSCWVKPIDTRTDTEKAVYGLRVSYDIWHKTPSENGFIRWFVDDIKAGKITGVKWVGND